MEKKRLDIALVESGLVETRSQAIQLIKDNAVLVNGSPCNKASKKVLNSEISLSKTIEFVSRGAHKLAGAFHEFSLDFKNLTLADIGASTGGFTDFALQNGAKKVFAIDVGHDQLALKLRGDDRVVNLEGTNIRHGVELEEKVDRVVVDLSYISLRLVLKPILELLREDGDGVFLIKPQFEVGKDGVGKGGIVKNIELRRETLLSLFDFFNEHCSVKSAIRSPLEGKSGNIEYLFYIEKGKNASSISKEEVSQL